MYILFRKDISFPFPMVSKDVVKGNIATDDHITQGNTDESDILVMLGRNDFCIEEFKENYSH